MTDDRNPNPDREILKARHGRTADERRIRFRFSPPRNDESAEHRVHRLPWVPALLGASGIHEFRVILLHGRS